LGQSVQKPTVSARASSEPLDFNEIGEDDDFTVITSRREQTEINLKPIITEAAINIALSSCPFLRVVTLGNQNTKTTNSLPHTDRKSAEVKYE
jgi:hypothetical protein